MPLRSPIPPETSRPGLCPSERLHRRFVGLLGVPRTPDRLPTVPEQEKKRGGNWMPQQHTLYSGDVIPTGEPRPAQLVTALSLPRRRPRSKGMKCTTCLLPVALATLSPYRDGCGGGVGALGFVVSPINMPVKQAALAATRRTRDVSSSINKRYDMRRTGVFGLLVIGGLVVSPCGA